MIMRGCAWYRHFELSQRQLQQFVAVRPKRRARRPPHLRQEHVDAAKHVQERLVLQTLRQVRRFGVAPLPKEVERRFEQRVQVVTAVGKQELEAQGRVLGRPPAFLEHQNAEKLGQGLVDV